MTTIARRPALLPFHRPEITEDDIDAVVGVLRSGWLTSGPRTRAFEAACATLVGAPHAVAVSSGTAALHLALETLGVSVGDEVIVPTMTFAASAEAVGYSGATPVFVDCRPDSLTIDPDAAARAIGPRTKAIMAVHLGGHPCRMEALLAVARAASLPIVEDAAHALGAAYRETPIGAVGDLTCFSFYATKPVTTGEGGMVTTGNGDHARRLRTMRGHGIVPAPPGAPAWDYRIEARGFKYNLPDMAAALGLSQLRRCGSMQRRREQIARLYDEAFSAVSALRVPHRDPRDRAAWHLYPVRLVPERLRVDRGQFARRLRALNIGTSVHFRPLHQHPRYTGHPGVRTRFPHADAAFETMVSLPIYPSLTDQDVADVVDAVLTTVERSRR